MDFYLALAGALMGALSLLLHALGKKYPKAEEYADDIDKVKDIVPKT